MEFTLAELGKSMREAGLVKENQTFLEGFFSSRLYENDLLRLVGSDLLSMKTMVNKSISQRKTAF